MKIKPIWWTTAGVLVLTAFALVPLVAAQKENGISYKKDIQIDRTAEQKQLVAWGGTVVIEGKIRKDVLVVGSELTISGEIGDSVVGIGARVHLMPTAVINGDLVILGGTLVREDGSRIGGDTVYFKSDEFSPKFLKEGFRGIFSVSFVPFFLILKFVSLFIWALLAVIVAAAFPKNVTAAAAELRRSPWPAVGTGLVAVVAYTFLVAFATVLCLILIGIPIVLALAAIGMVIKIFGRVVIFFAVGESLSRAFRKKTITPIAGAMLGLLVLGFIGFMPVISFLVSFVLSLLGWGIAIRTKFGLTDNWFRRGGPAPSPLPGPNFK